MTKMHRGKKAAASLMAGILLCQMFVFGVSKTSADAREVAKKMSFEVVGEGIVTVTDTAERTQEITSGSVIEVPKGMCVRVQAESPKETEIMSWKMYQKCRENVSGETSLLWNWRRKL